MSANIAELERLLQTRWDRETLAVYADGLLAAGDPRGELIALDLHAETHGLAAAAEAQRRDRLHAWLGGADLYGRPWHPELFRFGFLDDLYIAGDARASAVDYTKAFLRSPAARFTRGIKIVAKASVVMDVVVLLATREYPWLEFLSIQHEGNWHGPLSRGVTERMLAAAPQLHTLDLDGAEVVRADALGPQIRRLELRGPDAIVLGQDLPGVEELEIVIARADGLAIRGWPRVLLERLPNVRVLDLAGNEPAAGASDAFALVADLDIRRFAHVRLPSPRTQEHVTIVHRLVVEAPDTRIEVARQYGAFAQLDGGPAPRPWPPADVLRPNETIRVTLPPRRDVFAQRERRDATVILPLAECVALLEDDYDAMPAEAQAAWTAFWELMRTTRVWLPPATFARALLALDDIDLATGGFGPWRALGEQLRERDYAPDASVTIYHRTLG